MKLQVLQDNFGKSTGVFIPIADWEIISKKYKELQSLVSFPKKKNKISELAGKLSKETADELIVELDSNRKNWEKRIDLK